MKSISESIKEFKHNIKLREAKPLKKPRLEQFIPTGKHGSYSKIPPKLIDLLEIAEKNDVKYSFKKIWLDCKECIDSSIDWMEKAIKAE